MATVTVPNTLTAGTPATAADVEGNFSYVESFIQNNAIQKDASLAFTAVPSGPATDPSSANQLARKAYVDGRSGVLAKVSITGAGAKAAGNVWTPLTISTGNFTWPTIVAGTAVTVTAHVPVWAVETFGGGFPNQGGILDVGLFKNGTDTDPVQLGRTIAPVLGAFQPDGSPSTTIVHTYTDNVAIAPGTTVNFTLRGRVPNGTDKGRFWINADARWPAQITVSVV